MSEIRFDGRVALVTGAGRGMGRSHAMLLAQRGAKVIVNDIGVMMDGRDGGENPADAVVREIADAGGTAISDYNDVSSETGVAKMVQAAIDAFGRLDIVVHNAGVVTFIPFGEMTYQQYRQVVGVHTDGGFLLAKAAWPHMVSQGYGRFIFITSQAALSGITNLVHYGVAKTALTGLARSLALEGAEHGIVTNALGVTAYTRMMEGLFEPTDANRSDVYDSNDAKNWWAHYMRPELTSAAVAWLASDCCTINGQTLDTGGGVVAQQQLMMTQGYAKVDLTPEDVRDNVAVILDGAPGRNNFKSGIEFLDWQLDRVSAGGAPRPPKI
ncbi:NAD(P)-dependent dehydrogenase (short-subunit alcohol dehydrogenase family) [Sphingobium xenophagum]|uniref:NAD(P)-dependent dehydrogenase (Short-subunit alcohol dehydrogenase family) n=1 Tax=Sphingobium xenophagum TaxID=121428 RepID=A0ABU1X6M2_SPHXE|nr:SDR family NAD(P)-dependent oxidoreductase [Sphingobium xenophagum]MDR7157238.1 NAD(P)-dependent dehydrogenase (short-subunit alcohol dehydrogenase family) [Sphingobium xenophagum]